MRRAAKVDANHSSVVDTLRQVGAYVVDIHSVPGACDLFVAYHGVWTLLEIKDGRKVASAKRATDAERETLRNALGQQAPSWIIYDETEALMMIGAIESAQWQRDEVIERTHEEVSR